MKEARELSPASLTRFRRAVGSGYSLSGCFPAGPDSASPGDGNRNRQVQERQRLGARSRDEQECVRFEYATPAAGRALESRGERFAIEIIRQRLRPATFH